MLLSSAVRLARNSALVARRQFARTATPISFLAPLQTTAVRSLHASTASRFSIPAAEQDEYQPELPTITIAKGSASVMVTPPSSSKYYRAHQPSTTLHPIWLRDNCPCPKCIHPSTRQKLHTSSQVPLNISVSSVQVYPEGLELTWSKGLENVGDGEEPEMAKPGHTSLYPWEMIFGSYGGTPSEH